MFFPDGGMALRICSGVGGHFSMEEKSRRGKRVKMRNVCTTNGLFFSFASALDPHIRWERLLVDGAAFLAVRNMRPIRKKGMRCALLAYVEVMR
jgi:hypothetical protein